MSVDPMHSTSGADPVPDRSAELDRAEARLDLEEREVFAEVKAKGASIKAIARALEQFAAAVDASVDEHGETPALSGLQSRCRAVVVPHIDFEGHAERVLTVRADALRARRWVMESLQNDLARVAREVSTLTTLLDESGADLELAKQGGGGPFEPDGGAVNASEPADDAAVAGAEDGEPTVATRDRRVDARPASNGRRNTSEYRMADRFGRGEGPAVVAAEDLETAEGPDEVDEPESDNPAAPRSSPRVRMETEISCSSDSNFFTGLSANISDGGVFVATDEVLEPGTTVDLYFRLPSGISIEGQGIVKWVRPSGVGDEPHGVGIGFHDLDEGAEEAISHFLAERDPIFYIS